MPVRIAAAVADLSAVFSRLRLRWYVFGAQAVIAAGVPRLTADLDVTVESPKGGTKKLVDALAAAGLPVGNVGDLDSFIAETRVIPVIHKASGLPVDIVLAGPGLEEDMMTRVIVRKIGKTAVPFVETSDLIALKLLAGRPKDLEDVAALLRAAAPDLSVEDTRRRVAELGAIVDDGTLIPTFDRLLDAPRARAARKPASAKRPAKPKPKPKKWR